jgi:LPS-assembly protein
MWIILPVAALAADEGRLSFTNESLGQVDKTTIRAEQMTGRPSRVLNLDGQVKVERGLSTLYADSAEYRAIENLIMANGNVKMYRDGDCYKGDSLIIKMDTGEGFLSNLTYQLQKNNARGFAKSMTFVDDDRSVIDQGVYTTCEGTKPDWYLRSSRLDLDRGRDEGVATNGMVYFKEIPILASPWLSFPISGGRRSGFLPPIFNSTTTGGAELTLPYYVDIAPNRDATLFPKYIFKRGAQLGGEFRYLDFAYNGMFHGEVTPNDQLTDTTRYSVSFHHNHTLLPDLSLDFNYSRASDGQYAVDYSHSVTESSQHLLPQNFTLVYRKPWGTVGFLMSNYQVLQDAKNTIVKPVQTMPKLFAQFEETDFLGGFDWSASIEYAKFFSTTVVTGNRLAANAQISYPISGPYYFVIPKVMYHLSAYDLKSNLVPGFPTNPRLSVPTFSLDSGLSFERETTMFGHDVIQTLEPRLFYVKTPFRDQATIPLFDTGISDMNMSQIFIENRFSGQDRVGDANQLTAGLTSRFIETDGQERVRLAIAQRFNFSQPLVVNNYFFVTNPLLSGERIVAIDATEPARSDLIAAASGKLTDTLSAQATWQHSNSQPFSEKMSIGFRWQPAPMKVINAEYRYQSLNEINPAAMKQLDVSIQWPLASRWYGVARSNYSIPDRRILDGLIGVEYKQDCWIFRTVVQRYLVPSSAPDITSASTTSLFLQLELNGLSKIGTNPLHLLKRSIPGYQPINQPNVLSQPY